MSEIYYNVSMSEYTTWKVGAVARKFIILESEDDIRRSFEQHPDAYVLGNGSNILVLDDVGVVVKLGRMFLASKKLHLLAQDFARAGRSGLEFVMGIPATVGGAIKMNAGGKYGSMSDVISSVVVYQDGEIKKVQPKFGYRTSDIQGLILSAEFNTQRNFPECVRERMHEILDAKKKTQPLGQPSAGCIFKNLPDKPAGQIIDQLGLKGKKFGGAKVSEKHANFITTRKGCSAHDVMTAIYFVKQTVFEQTGLTLDLEIEIWPRYLSDYILVHE